MSFIGFSALFVDIQIYIVNLLDDVNDLLALSETSHAMHSLVFSKCNWDRCYHRMFQERACRETMEWPALFQTRYLAENRRNHKAYSMKPDTVAPITVNAREEEHNWSHFYLSGAALYEGSHWFEVKVSFGIAQIGWFSVGFDPSYSRGIGDSCGASYDGSRSCLFAGTEREIEFEGASWATGDVIRCCVELSGDIESAKFRYFRNGEDLGEPPFPKPKEIEGLSLPLFAGFTCKDKTVLLDWSPGLQGPLIECYSRIGRAYTHTLLPDIRRKFHLQFMNAPLSCRMRLVPAPSDFDGDQFVHIDAHQDDDVVYYRLLKRRYLRLLDGSYCYFEGTPFLTQAGQCFHLESVDDQLRSLQIEEKIKCLEWFDTSKSYYVMLLPKQGGAWKSLKITDGHWDMGSFHPRCIELREIKEDDK